MKKYSFLPLFLLFSICCRPKVHGQASLESFGHNRVQYQRFDWKFYEAAHFKIYFYGRAGRSLARFVAEQAEQDVNAIEHNAGGLFPDRISIMLYNCYDDFKQSNIGLSSDLQMQNNNPAGTVHLVGDKLVVFFNGSHADLKKQLRQGMAQVIMEHLIFGINFREMVRNAVLLDLPQWVTDGYVDYIVDGWTAKDDNDWKNIVTQNKPLYFNDLTLENPRLAGKAFWKYVSTRYGEHKIKDLLYLVQLKGSMNKASKMAFNQKIPATFDSVLTFYQNRYKQEQSLFEPLDTANALIKIPLHDNKETEIRNIVVSPRGSDVAYVMWEHGEYKVILEKTHRVSGEIKEERSTILYGGVKDYEAKNDPDYPLLAWDNTGYKLGIVYKMGNFIRIKVYNSIKGSIWSYRIPKSRFDRITGFSFMQDDEKIVISAVKNGQSDLFTLQFRGYRLKQLTDDAWDDAAPVFVSGGSRKGIVFLSNRPQPYMNIKPLPNELPTGKMNAFFYSTTTESDDLLQLTRESKGTITDIIPFGQDNFAYLSDKSGVNNRYLVLFARDKNNMDSAYSVPVTNYGRSIRYQNYNPASAKVADAIQYKDAYYVYFKPIYIPHSATDESLKTLPKINFVDGVSPRPKTTPVDISTSPESIFEKNDVHKAQKNISGGLQINSGDIFQSNFPETPIGSKKEKQAEALPNDYNEAITTDTFSIPKAANNQKTTIASSSHPGQPEMKDGKHIRYVDSTYLDMRSHRYYLSFQPDFFSLRLDNNLIFNRYQSYGQNAGQYRNPSLAGMIMARLFDKMEDYRFTGGLRIPANFSGLSYFMQFENFRRRLDWGLIFYREENKQTYNFITGSGGGGNQNILQIPGKTVSNILQAKLSYPLDEVRSIHFYLGGRQDRMLIKAQDYYGLILPNVEEDWAMARLEFISDNTKSLEMNLWQGLRYKLFAESMYKAYSNNDVYQLNTDTASFKEHATIYNLGFDARYYHPLYKHFIFAMRLAGAHSGGSQQIVYFLGGEANAINSKFGNGMAPSPKMDYAYQGLATDLRGYDQNARNGNTYVLGNFELRLPILTTFLHRPIQSTILKNLQAVAFVDIGNAWEGLIPTEDNLKRPYQFNWPPNTNVPVVNVQIPNTSDNGVAIGYGLGLRTMLWGYFIRADAALNKQKNFHWYLSFGTDF